MANFITHPFLLDLFTERRDYADHGYPVPAVPVIRKLPKTMVIGPGRNILNLKQNVEFNLARLDCGCPLLVHLATEHLVAITDKLNQPQPAG